jgi:hypothetical protein
MVNSAFAIFFKPVLWNQILTAQNRHIFEKKWLGAIYLIQKDLAVTGGRAL